MRRIVASAALLLAAALIPGAGASTAHAQGSQAGELCLRQNGVFVGRFTLLFGSYMRPVEVTAALGQTNCLPFFQNEDRVKVLLELYPFGGRAHCEFAIPKSTGQLTVTSSGIIFAPRIHCP